MADMISRAQAWLNASSVAGGKVIPLVIDRVDLDVEVGKDKQKKDVLRFRNDNRGLILRPVLIKQLAAELNCRNSDEWVGQAIEAYEVTIEIAGQLKPALRLRKARSA